ncbi:hypothetical protein ADICYQ_3811 [Cyclobacterium qasimii M12-11B]|uniref:Uncharacterized protein n=1 Tax=Cyclobacterium qasimii M12-11B TaxID=641524 RepID=S7VBB5_9BACT|nr:hypothetical protein ADICYQ_3811 [Cyclobacterium qasimii M12-11B]
MIVIKIEIQTLIEPSIAFAFMLNQVRPIGNFLINLGFNR